MQPTPEIIAAACEFHALGGTRGLENKSGRWFIIGNELMLIYESIATKGEWYNSFDGRHVNLDISHFSDKCYPILTESELWSWLWERGYRIKQYSPGAFEIEQYAGFVGEHIWTIVYKIEADNLHAALYDAANFVAKEKRG